MKCCLVLIGCLPGLVLFAAEPEKMASQNPSPMVEHTRKHPRLKEEHPPGRRETLKIGTLFLPEKLPAGEAPLLVHFHGGTWIPEVAAAKAPCAVISVQVGSGSAAYAKPFVEAAAFGKLLHEAETKAGRKFAPVVLSAWSAGYGSIRAILKAPENYRQIDSVILLDGLHCGYVDGKPGPAESRLVAPDLAIFVQWALDAAAGQKQFLLTHTEIFPGTFASTTETADYLLQQLNLQREPVLRWGPLGTQILGEARRGRFHVLSFAGNSAPDHIDLLHALPELLQEIDMRVEQQPHRPSNSRRAPSGRGASVSIHVF